MTSWVKLQVDGTHRLTTRFNKMQTYGKDMSVPLRRAAIDLRKVARDIVPVKSGDLRRSINFRKQSNTAYIIGTDLFYSVFVEYGHHSWDGWPYMTPAFMEVAPKVPQYVAQYIRESMVK